MQSRVSRLIGVVFLVAGLTAAAAVAIGLVVDVLPITFDTLGDPGPHGHVQESMRDLARLLGVILSMIIALCAIAIPLTANVYTPKLIEIFVHDRGNRLVLAFYVLANLFVIWSKFVIDDGLPPSTRLRVFASLLLTSGGLMLLPFYLFYVFTFLIPRGIVRRLEEEITTDLSRAGNLTGERLEEVRQRTLNNIQYLGMITLRSVERYDRDTAVEGLRGLRSVFDTYQAHKGYLAAGWHHLEKHELPGLGPELRVEVVKAQATVEVAILLEMGLVLPVAMGRLGGVVALLASLTRHFGVRTNERRDLGPREMTTLFFNTFLRNALARQHSDTFYKFVYQYRRFGEECLDSDPQHARRIVFFLDYYGHQAVRMNMGFLINVVAYDIANVVDLAYRRGSPGAEQLLDVLIALDRDQAALLQMPGVIKAQMILAARLRTRGQSGPAERLLVELKKVPTERLAEAFGHITATREEHFWEIADRRRHLDHVEPEFRPALERLRRQLLGERTPGHNTQLFLRAAVDVGGDVEGLGLEPAVPAGGKKGALVDASGPVKPLPVDVCPAPELRPAESAGARRPTDPPAPILPVEAPARSPASDSARDVGV